MVHSTHLWPTTDQCSLAMNREDPSAPDALHCWPSPFSCHTRGKPAKKLSHAVHHSRAIHTNKRLRANPSRCCKVLVAVRIGSPFLVIHSSLSFVHFARGASPSHWGGAVSGNFSGPLRPCHPWNVLCFSLMHSSAYKFWGGVPPRACAGVRKGGQGDGYLQMWRLLASFQAPEHMEAIRTCYGYVLHQRVAREGVGSPTQDKKRGHTTFLIAAKQTSINCSMATANITLDPSCKSKNTNRAPNFVTYLQRQQPWTYNIEGHKCFGVLMCPKPPIVFKRPGGGGVRQGGGGGCSKRSVQVAILLFRPC
eukprot:1156962-Pelagomonas_calceolata.AAC.11